MAGINFTDEQEYAPKLKFKNNVVLADVSRRSEQLFCDCEIKGSSFQLDTGEICCCKCEKERAK